jgi:hypothetical protein
MGPHDDLGGAYRLQLMDEVNAKIAKRRGVNLLLTLALAVCILLVIFG